MCIPPHQSTILHSSIIHTDKAKTWGEFPKSKYSRKFHRYQKISTELATIVGFWEMQTR